MQDDTFSGLVALLEELFEGMDSDITTALLGRDEQYAALWARLGELEQWFPFIESVMGGKGAVHLTAEEHTGLVEYIRITDKAENRERLNLVMANGNGGGADIGGHLLGFLEKEERVREDCDDCHD